MLDYFSDHFAQTMERTPLFKISTWLWLFVHFEGELSFPEENWIFCNIYQIKQYHHSKITSASLVQIGQFLNRQKCKKRNHHDFEIPKNSNLKSLTIGPLTFPRHSEMWFNSSWTFMAHGLTQLSRVHLLFFHL